MSKEEKYRDEIIELKEPVVDTDIIDLTETTVDDSVILELRAPIVDQNVIELTEIVDIDSQDAEDTEIKGFNINDIETDYNFESEVKQTESKSGKVDISDDLSDFEISREFESVDSDPFGDSDLSGDFSADDIDSFFDSEPSTKTESKGFSVPKLSGLPDLTKGRQEKSVELSGDFSADDIDSFFDNTEPDTAQDTSDDFSVDDIDALFDSEPITVTEPSGFKVPKLSGLPDLTKKREAKPDISEDLNGSFSMDEIDSMFDSDTAEADEKPAEDISGDFSVDDIDALFDSMDSNKDTESKGFEVPRLSGLPDLTKKREVDSDISEDLNSSFSMDEIDSMFDNDTAEADEKPAEDISEDFSVDDIDALFDSMDSNNDTESKGFEVPRLSGLPDLTKKREVDSDISEDLNGSFSMDEIDSMFDDNKAAEEKTEDLNGSFSLDEIDSMFDDNKAAEEKTEDLSGNFSLDEIDSMFDDNKAAEEKTEDLSGNFSLDEIDSMFDGAEKKEEAPVMEDTLPDLSESLVADDDLEALFNEINDEVTEIEEPVKFDVPKLSGLPDLTKPAKRVEEESAGSFSPDEIDSMFDNDEDKVLDESSDDDFSVDDIDALLESEMAKLDDGPTDFNIKKLNGLPDLTRPRQPENSASDDFNLSDGFSDADIDALFENVDNKKEADEGFKINKLSGLPDLTKPREPENIADDDFNLADGFSDADIDALFENKDSEPETKSDFKINKLSGLPDLTKPRETEDKTEAFSTDDIDSLFDSDEEITLPEPENEAFSTDDIDALLESEMNNLDDEKPDFNIQKLSGLPDLTKPSVPETLVDDDLDPAEGFSDSDINALFDNEETIILPEPEGNFSTDDIDALLNNEMNALDETDDSSSGGFEINKLSGLPDLTKPREIKNDNEVLSDGFSSDDIESLFEKEVDKALDISSYSDGFKIGKLSGLPDLTKKREVAADEPLTMEELESFFGEEEENNAIEGFNIKKLSGLPDLTSARTDEKILSMDEVDSMLTDVQEGKYDDELTEADAGESFLPMDSDDLTDLMLDKLDIGTEGESHESVNEIRNELNENPLLKPDFEGKVSVSKEQIEEAVQSIVKGMYSKKIELMLLDAIEETVKKELENFKNKVKE